MPNQTAKGVNPNEVRYAQRVLNYGTNTIDEHFGWPKGKNLKTLKTKIHLLLWADYRFPSYDNKGKIYFDFIGVYHKEYTKDLSNYYLNPHVKEDLPNIPDSLWKRLDIWVEEHQGMISSKEKRNRSKINKLDKEGLNLTVEIGKILGDGYFLTYHSEGLMKDIAYYENGILNMIE